MLEVFGVFGVLTCLKCLKCLFGRSEAGEGRKGVGSVWGCLGVFESFCGLQGVVGF